MRKIVKGREPREWTEYRATPGAEYQSIPELRDSLLKEQGYICAYCMRRIPHRDRNSNEDSRIDHIWGRNHKERELDYSNMVICCPGAISGNKDFHCDKCKNDRDLSFSLFDDNFFNTLKYNSKDGTISSSNPQWDKEINEILNLNNSLLKENRRQVMEGVIVELKKQDRAEHWMRTQLGRWQSKDEYGMFRPYCGIVEWFLKKHINRNH